MGFSSQFHFIVCLTTTGIMMLTFGLTTMIRNDYNPFAEPLLPGWAPALCLAEAPFRLILQALAARSKVWDVPPIEATKIDVTAWNRLDGASRAKKLAKTIVENHFRHKFVRVNREWIIHNIATILGGKNYIRHAGAELPYLQAIHQRAVNAEEVEKRLDAEQQQVKNDLALMPYNIRAMQQKQKENAHLGLGDAPGSDIDVTDDSVSDLPAPHWTCKPPLKQPYVQRLARMWMGFARQNLRLKSLVSDIVASQLRAHCTRCRSVYRL
jgi:hypothetical protein